ncbi:MAG: SIMPL domain-containing protein [Neisseria sp.]|nr:SIMPL domain-containing protein [Neisseria sp.]
MRKTALCLLPFLAAPAFAESLNYNVVSFSEQATMTVPQDLMTVNLMVHEEGSNRQNVSNTVTRRLNIVQAKIAENRALKAELTDRRSHPQYDKGKIVRWSDSAYLQVKSKDFQALNKLVAAVQKEAVLQGLHFSVSPEKRTETTNELSKQALKNFQTRAKTISNTLGASGYKIVNININSSFQTRSAAAPVMLMAKSAMAYDAAPEMMADNPGTEEISQTVSGSIQAQM